MSKRVLVFTTAVCGPCKVMKPELLAQAAARQFDLMVIEANEATQEQFSKYGVRVVPTVVLLENDQEVGRFAGAKTLPKLNEQLDEWGL